MTLHISQPPINNFRRKHRFSAPLLMHDYVLRLVPHNTNVQ